MSDYTTIPERLIYFLQPVEISCVREIIRSHKLYDKCDLTDLQFSKRVGVCPRLISSALSSLESRKIIIKHQLWINGKERRAIGFGNQETIVRELFGNLDVQKIIETKIMNRLKGKVEYARIMQSQTDFKNQPWIMLPNSIDNPNQLSIYAILYGQYNRGGGEIRISNSQLSALSGLGLSAVKGALAWLKKSDWIVISGSNKRDRRILLHLANAGKCLQDTESIEQAG